MIPEAEEEAVPVKDGVTNWNRCCLGAAASGTAYGVRKLLKQKRRKRPSMKNHTSHTNQASYNEHLESVYLILIPSLALTGIPCNDWMVFTRSITNNGGAGDRCFIDSKGAMLSSTDWPYLSWYSFKMDMCRFAYTTYGKTLIELRNHARVGVDEYLMSNFLTKLSTP